MYGASKAFVKQFSLNLRADLAGHHIRVTNIEPGLCEGTEFSTVRFKGDKQRSEKLYEGAHAIQPVDIADTVAWIVGQPPHVNINHACFTNIWSTTRFSRRIDRWGINDGNKSFILN